CAFAARALLVTRNASRAFAYKSACLFAYKRGSHGPATSPCRAHALAKKSRNVMYKLGGKFFQLEDIARRYEWT
ncbi:hypothetical protein BJV74DRAFT_860064, partial [Russula compacta]